MRSRHLIFPLLLLGLVPPLQAGEADAAAAWASAKAAAVDELEGIAGRANGRKLYRSRNEIYEIVLAFAPDHRKARSWLKYKRRDGVWVRRRYTPPKDRGSQASSAEHTEAVRAWRSWWREQVTRVHGQAVDAGDAGTAESVLQLALGLWPDDPAFRALAGEARYGKGPEARWILSDTHRALANRARFLGEARGAARRVPAAKQGRPRKEDRGDLFAWPTVLTGETVRVVGAVSPTELARHHEIAESAAAVFASVFGVDARLPSDSQREDGTFPLYVTATREQGNGFLVTEPGIAKRDLAVLGDLDLSFLPTRPGAVVKTTSPELRWEATAHAVHAHFARAHLGHEAGALGAWAQEAVATYLVWLQVRTRLLFSAQGSSPAPAGSTGPFGRPVQGDGEEAEYLVDSTIDWYAQAAAAVEEMTVPELRIMAARSGRDLGSRDLLGGYGLAVYVLEVHPERSAAFFRDVASQDVVVLDVLLRKHLGRDLASLRPHLLRWLREMSELAPPAGDPR